MEAVPRPSSPNLSCGVLVTHDGRLLLGLATGTKRWDIPKGLAEPGEREEQAARRELLEETGLEAPPGALRLLGRHPYRPGKDLALFAWSPETPPDPAILRCTSMVTLRNGRTVPELARFALAPWPEALTLVAKSLALVLRALGSEA